jgi:DNA-binding FrmR family transcriptional regulator
MSFADEVLSLTAHAWLCTPRWSRRADSNISNPQALVLQSCRETSIVNIPMYTIHADVALRLKRTEQHLSNAIAMIEASQNCVDVAKQLHVIEKTIIYLKQKLIREHIEHCLEEKVGGNPECSTTTLSDFREIINYL